jgi:hypothetical protein
MAAKPRRVAALRGFCFLGRDFLHDRATARHPILYLERISTEWRADTSFEARTVSGS